MWWVLGTIAVVLLGALVAAAVAVLSYALRGTPVRRVRIPGDGSGSRWAGGGSSSSNSMSPVAASSDEFPDIAKVLSKTALTSGHTVRYFFNGDTLFRRLLEDVARAERLVTWHVFWFKPGRLATRVAEVLADRARAGVPVMLLLDHFGSKGIGASYIDPLRDAGVDVQVFRPLRWNTLYKAQHRMHIRTVVVDGCVGYTGGFGIDDRWDGDGRHAGQWRDSSARIEGEAVTQLQGAFVANWAEATGDLLLGDRVFDFDRAEAVRGAHVAGLMYSSPSLGSTSAERYFFTAIAAARERFWLTSAYFVPDRHLRWLLCEAAARGVDVRVLTPGPNTDRPSTWYAARAHYRELLAAGIRIYEYGPTMMHAKSLVVDGTWGMVGTLNFDNRSMVLNDEVGLLTWSPELGQQLEQAFLEDLEWSEEITTDSERRRTTPGDQVRQWAAQRVSRLL